jgi:hypothetical protein
MRYFIVNLQTICILFLLNACASTPEQKDPFATGREDFLSKVQTIALAPVSFENVHEAQNDFAQQVNDLVESELRQAGFKVVSSSVYQSINQQTPYESDLAVNPSTEKATTQELQKRQNRIHEKLADQHDVDAFLYPEVTAVTARFFQTGAKWDGVSESTTGKYGLGCSAGTENKKGTMPALSLRLKLIDSDGIVQYDRNGGIQLLSHYRSQGFKRVPESELYRDEDRNQQAVQVAVGPLVGKEQPQKGFFGSFGCILGR